MQTDDQRLAKASRALRRELGILQSDVTTSRYVCQQIEAARAGRLRLDLVREHFAALGARAQTSVWWNGAALDRLLDRSHAAVVETTATILPGYRFLVKTEFSFSNYGERGSIDVFAGREDVRAVLVGEAKSEWGSLEETLRRQDMKVRLAPKLALAAFGWTPRFVANVLIFPDDHTSRRIAGRYAATLSGYPARARDIRAWLRHPARDIGGIRFMTIARPDERGFGESGGFAETR